jgi:hypothetical protein
MASPIQPNNALAVDADEAAAYGALLTERNDWLFLKRTLKKELAKAKEATDERQASLIKVGVPSTYIQTQADLSMQTCVMLEATAPRLPYPTKETLGLLVDIYAGEIKAFGDWETKQEIIIAAVELKMAQNTRTIQQEHAKSPHMCNQVSYLTSIVRRR